MRNHESQQPGETPAQEPVPRSFLMLLTPDAHLRQRVRQQAFVDYVKTVVTTTEAYFEEVPDGPGLDLQVACAVLPQNRLVLELQTEPDYVPTEILDGLRQRLESLPRPAVRYGPVAFSSRSTIRGGCSSPGAGFGFPFLSVLRPGAQGDLDDLLLEAGGFTPEEPPTFTQQAVPILGVGVGLAVAAGISYLFGFQGREGLTQLFLLLLWVVAPMLGAVLGGMAAGTKWLPQGTDPALVVAGLGSLAITTSLFLTLFLLLGDDFLRGILGRLPLWKYILGVVVLVPFFAIMSGLHYLLRRKQDDLPGEPS